MSDVAERVGEWISDDPVWDALSGPGGRNLSGYMERAHRSDLVHIYHLFGWEHSATATKNELLPYLQSQIVAGVLTWDSLREKALGVQQSSIRRVGGVTPEYDLGEVDAVLAEQNFREALVPKKPFELRGYLSAQNAPTHPKLTKAQMVDMLVQIEIDGIEPEKVELPADLTGRSKKPTDERFGPSIPTS